MERFKNYESILAATIGIALSCLLYMYSKEDVMPVYECIIIATIFMLIIWFIYVYKNICNIELCNELKECRQKIFDLEIKYKNELDKSTKVNVLKVHNIDYKRKTILITSKYECNYPMGTILTLYYKDDNEYEIYLATVEVNNPRNDKIIQGSLFVINDGIEPKKEHIIVKPVITKDALDRIYMERENNE